MSHDERKTIYDERSRIEGYRVRDPKIERGVALLLCGPQGCGKTLLARKLAAAYGRFSETSFDRLRHSDFERGRHLRNGEKVLVVEGAPTTEDDVCWVREFVASETLELDILGRALTTIPTPNLIFCTETPSPLLFGPHGRRFRVFSMPSRLTRGS